jgi:hypothetical protein
MYRFSLCASVNLTRRKTSLTDIYRQRLVRTLKNREYDKLLTAPFHLARRPMGNAGSSLRHRIRGCSLLPVGLISLTLTRPGTLAIAFGHDGPFHQTGDRRPYNRLGR